MRSLTPQEKRTVRFGAIATGLYLVLFFGYGAWQSVQKHRLEYERLVREASALKQRLLVYSDKAVGLEGLMDQFRMDPAKITTNTLVSDAVTAIHNSAVNGGILLGPVRETASRSGGREIATIQLEGIGPVASILGFIDGVGSLGFPLVADAVQLSPDRNQPGSVKMTVTVVILDFEQWKATERRPDA